MRQAAAEFEKLAFTDGNVLGGRKSIASTNFGNAGNPMFDPKPGCMLYKQGSFITTFFPKDVQANLERRTSASSTSRLPRRAARSRSSAAATWPCCCSNTAGAREVMKLLADKSIGVPAMGTSFLSPHKDFDITAVQGRSSPSRSPTITYASSIFLFDGSDQMPGAVGAGTFWKDMTSWISGQESLDQALTNIDNSWPSSS